MSDYLFLSNEKNSQKLVVDVTIEEFSVLSSILHGEFDRKRGRYLRMTRGCLKVDKFFMSYFAHFKTLFDKVESLRLGRFVEYNVEDGFHYDVENGNKSVFN
jgi:hypothetical protein